jgi:Holliday junction resolvasome RuvABC endonuclease subunit
MSYRIAIDPSFTAFGLVVYDTEAKAIVDCATFRTKRESKKRGIYVADDDARRLLEITDQVIAYLEKYTPDVVYGETPSSGAKSSSAAKGLAYAKALGTIIPHTCGIPVVWVSAADAKKAATGVSNASKSAVETAMREKYPDAPWSKIKGENEHQFDAASVLTAGLNTHFVRI